MSIKAWPYRDRKLGNSKVDGVYLWDIRLNCRGTSRISGFCEGGEMYFSYTGGPVKTDWAHGKLKYSKKWGVYKLVFYADDGAPRHVFCKVVCFFFYFSLFFSELVAPPPTEHQLPRKA